MVIAPRKPNGFPTAIATSPGRIRAQSRAVATLRFGAEIRSAARSRRESRKLTSAVNSLPSHKVISAREPVATWALVRIVPSLFHITPEPLPRPPGCTKTVYRRTRSATSPKPGIPISVASHRPFPYDHADLARHAATQEHCIERLSNLLTMEMRVNIFQSHDRPTAQSDQNVANDDSRFMCRPVRFNFEHDHRGLLPALQGFPQMSRQPNGLQPDSEISPRNMPLGQQRFDHTIDRRHR